MSLAKGEAEGERKIKPTCVCVCVCVCVVSCVTGRGAIEGEDASQRDRYASNASPLAIVRRLFQRIPAAAMQVPHSTPASERRGRCGGWRQQAQADPASDGGRKRAIFCLRAVALWHSASRSFALPCPFAAA